MELVKRVLEDKIIEYLSSGKAVLIYGARLVEKTFLLHQIIDNFSGKVLLLNGEDYDSLALP